MGPGEACKMASSSQTKSVARSGGGRREAQITAESENDVLNATALSMLHKSRV